jgi:hypothetical protein
VYKDPCIGEHKTLIAADINSELIAALLPLYLAQIGGIGLGMGIIGGLT